MKYQVTLFDDTNTHKPVSAIIETEEKIDLGIKVERSRLANRGIQKICARHLWRGSDLKKFGYLRAKVREYDPDIIARINANRYDAIKEEKYASGEWKRPKSK